MIQKIIKVQPKEMPRSISYHEQLITALKEPLEAASYIEVVIEEGDPKMLLKALKNVIEAQGEINQSEQVKQSYEKLKQILVVDDEADMREFLVFLLEDYGAKVTVVTSAGEVLSTLKQLKPDLLISDIGMPEVDGYMLIRQIRGMPPEEGGGILAIALTAYASEIDQQQVLSAGFQMHLAKPIEPIALVKGVAKLMGRMGNIN